jgi:hypothetical protein
VLFDTIEEFNKMPKYYVYNKKSGDVVHVHETYDAVGGTSLPCTSEEVLGLVDETLVKKEDLKILKVESESQLAVGVTRVDPNTQKLV